MFITTILFILLAIVGCILYSLNKINFCSYVIYTVSICIIFVLCFFINKYKDTAIDYKSYLTRTYQDHKKEYQLDSFSDISDWNNIKWYTCISIDNGKTWYLINKDRKIIGDFNKLHPGLKAKIDKQHKALDEMAEYAKKNGPIGSKPLTEKEIKMLKECGAIK